MRGDSRRLVEAYGPDPLGSGEWWVPDRPDRLPTVLLVHGGYWRPTYDRALENAVAADLCARGFLCWNVDYSASDVPWPATYRDVAMALDHLARGAFAHRVDLSRVAVVGHSAGGCLALWLAGVHGLSRPPSWLATGRRVTPSLCVGQAPVAALAEAWRDRLGGGAVETLMGGDPDELSERYAVGDPLRLLPTGVPTVLIHGTRDEIVPLRQSELYVSAATGAGDASALVSFDGGHFEHLDPATEAGDLLRGALSRLRS